MGGNLTMSCFYDMRVVQGYEWPNAALAYINYRDGDYRLAYSFRIERGNFSPVDGVVATVNKMTKQMRDDGRFPEDSQRLIPQAIGMAVRGLEEYYREFPMTEEERATPASPRA